MQNQLPSHLLCVICDSKKSKKVIKILEKEPSLFSLVTHGKGTAGKKILNYLGLDETEKSIFFRDISEDGSDRIMSDVVSGLHLENPGQGIAFTLPVSQVSFHKRVGTAKDSNDMSQRKDNIMNSQNTQNLVIAIFNRGFSEEVMEIARKAGALGGTVLHAHGYGASCTERFLGISIAPEKEMLMMIVPETISGAIMDSIANQAGPTTDIHAVTFCLPVSDARGLRVTNKD